MNLFIIKIVVLQVKDRISLVLMNSFGPLILIMIVIIANAKALFGANHKVIGSICGATREDCRHSRPSLNQVSKINFKLSKVAIMHT